MAIELDIAKKSGSWFTYGDTRIGQGRENAKQFLDEHPEIAAELEEKVRGLALGVPEKLPASLEADVTEEEADYALA